MQAPKSIKIAQDDVDTDWTLTASWTGATDLGDLKGSPFAKATFEPKSVQTQNGNKTIGATGKVEASALITVSDTIATAIRAMEGKNVALLCTPKGTPGANNKLVIFKNFLLQRKGEINIGEPSFITLFNDNVPVLDETDLIQEIAALGP
jgi:hypothetical protein